jgi:transposase-like protein
MLSQRRTKGAQIASSPGICWLEKNIYLVPSQTSDKKYTVDLSGDFWKCTCADYVYRKKRCKHMFALAAWLALKKETEAAQTVPEIPLCWFCKSTNIIKYGNRATIIGKRQRHFCKDCNRQFTLDPVKKCKGDGKTVAEALTLYFSGLSLRSVENHFRQNRGFVIHHVTILRWVRKFMRIVIDHTSKHYPIVSQTWHVDEMMVKVKGEYRWVWNLLDYGSKFLIATTITKERSLTETRAIFKKAKRATAVRPSEIISDGMQSYGRAIRKEYSPHRIPKIEHKSFAGINKIPNNNPVERFNNTLRQREKTMRGFHDNDGASDFVEGHRTFYNYCRPHMTLDGATPAEACGVNLQLGGNKMLGLIEHAAKDECHDNPPRKVCSFTIKVFDENQKEVVNKRKFRTAFGNELKAGEFARFYQTVYPKMTFVVGRNVLTEQK